MIGSLHPRRVAAAMLAPALALAHLTAQAPAPPATGDWMEVSDRVVKIQSKFASGRSETGAGLIVGTQGTDLVIATAAHVVWQGGSGSAPQRALETTIFLFRDRLRGMTSVGPLDTNLDVDIALLTLAAPEIARRFADMPPLCVREPVEHERVTTIGHPETDWQVNAIDSVMRLTDEVDRRRFVITSQGPDLGSSGGPVLGQEGCVMGLVVNKRPREARVTKIDDVMALAVRGFNIDLLGGTTPTGRLEREKAFLQIAQVLNSYVFDLQGVQATFNQKLILGDSLVKVIEAYNASYRRLYDGRDAYGLQVKTHWGRHRGDEWADLVNTLDRGHKEIIFTKMNYLVATLKLKKKLSGADQKLLEQLLPQLAGITDTAAAGVRTFVDRLQPSAGDPR